MNAPIEEQLRDYFTMVDRMQGPADPTAQSQDTPALSLVTENIHDPNESTMEVIMISPDRNEPHNRSRTWMLVAAGIAAVALVGGLIVAANRGSDEAPADQPTVTVVEQTPDVVATTTAPETTLAPTTSTTESAEPPATETMEVPFYILDSMIPTDQFTCLSGASNFEVEFVDEAGVGTVAHAVTERYFAPSIADPPINTTCTDIAAAADGQPAVLFSAVLDAPSADVYQSIGVKYLFDDFEIFFEEITRAQAEAGLYLEYSDNGILVIGPEDVQALQFTE